MLVWFICLVLLDFAESSLEIHILKGYLFTYLCETLVSYCLIVAILFASASAFFQKNIGFISQLKSLLKIDDLSNFRADREQVLTNRFLRSFGMGRECIVGWLCASACALSRCKNAIQINLALVSCTQNAGSSAQIVQITIGKRLCVPEMRCTKAAEHI